MTSRSNLMLKSKFTPFCVCPDDKSPQIEVTVSKFGHQMHFTTVAVPINLDFK